MTLVHYEFLQKSMKSDLKPFIRLGAGLAIGYNKPLASTEGEITLGGGTHFLLAKPRCSARSPAP